jgi:hypothetical protein
MHRNSVTKITLKYIDVFQWLRRGFELVNQFIGSSLVVTTISSYSLKITIAQLTTHTKSSHSHILLYPLGTDHAQKTQFYCFVAQTTQKTSHTITISPVHWRADCCLATRYKHSSYCCVTLSEVFIAPLLGNALTCRNIYWNKCHLSWEPNKTHTYTVWSKWRVLLR